MTRHRSWPGLTRPSALGADPLSPSLPRRVKAWMARPTPAMTLKKGRSGQPWRKAGHDGWAVP